MESVMTASTYSACCQLLWVTGCIIQGTTCDGSNADMPRRQSGELCRLGDVTQSILCRNQRPNKPLPFLQRGLSNERVALKWALGVRPWHLVDNSLPLS